MEAQEESQVEAECSVIKEYLKKGSEALISFLLGKKTNERQALRTTFKTLFNIDLEEQINKNLSGNFRRVIIDLIRRKSERDAIYLFKALKGPIINEDTLIEILCTRPNIEIMKIKEEYALKYNGEESLEKKIMEKTKGNLRDLLLAILKCERSENSIPDNNQCKLLVKEIYNEEKKTITENEEIIHKVFVKCSPPEIYSINQIYLNNYRTELASDIEKVFNSHMKTALLTILEGIIVPSEYFAKRINKSVKGLGTNDKMLVRVLTTRERIDMPQIRKSYQKIFGKDMIEDIKDDTSGKYQTAVVALASGD